MRPPAKNSDYDLPLSSYPAEEKGVQGAFLQYKSSFIHYLCFGTGKKILFAFHGYNENALSLLVLEKSLGAKYTVIAPDIPYHGKTEWKEENHFNTDDFIAIVRLFISENVLHPAEKIERFSVLGFSMGGKCALYVAHAYTDKIDELFLLASDGIRTNKVYNVAVYPKWGRGIFKTTIRHPTWFFAFINMMNKLKLLSPWLYKFTYNHMDTKEKRQRLYNTWISMAEFNPDIEKVKEQLNLHDTRVFLFFGVRDEVIPVQVGDYFADGLRNCTFTRLDRGHYFIDDKLNPIIEEALKAV
ncbi:MAG: alpha/beta hydrolase [Chitinophagales bacterium]|nr:alpha/beta hydrolase [Chitinophagales bacterium]